MATTINLTYGGPATLTIDPTTDSGLMARLTYTNRHGDGVRFGIDREGLDAAIEALTALRDGAAR
jgi:hypothetical protein